MNINQKNYATAKALNETLEEKLEEMERQFIAKRGIKNNDGEVPRRIYAINNDEAFEQASAEFDALPEVVELWAAIVDSRKTLQVAEDELIKYGLALLPTMERATFTDACEKDYTTRKKVIDLTFRLDASTVK